MYCEICDKMVISKNKYDIIHQHFVCTSCMEMHHLNQETDEETLEALIAPGENHKRSLYPFLFKCFAIIFLIHVLVIVFRPNQYAEAIVTYQYIFMFLVLLGLGKIINLLETR